MRLLFVGDVVGRAGRAAIADILPGLIRDYALDFVVVNGENSAGGFGITEEICQDFLDAGADAVTLGNHAWDQREALVFIERQPKLVRPVNFPPGTPGRGATLAIARNGAQVLVINAMGRVYMDALDDPFAAIDRELAKRPLGHYLDGRASLVVGTHTHVPTADHQILAGGTAYMSDAGMTGDYDSVLGMEKDEPISRFLRKIPSGRFQPAMGEPTLSGVAVEVSDRTGLAEAIGPVRIGGRLSEALPTFW